MKRSRIKDGAHLDFIRGLQCCVCGNNIETEAAHLRAGNLDYGKLPTGMGEKPSDRWTLPLCSQHHREQHSMSEVAFWSRNGINPWVLAMSLYVCSGDHAAASVVIERQRLTEEV